MRDQGRVWDRSRVRCERRVRGGSKVRGKGRVWGRSRVRVE